MKTLRKTSVVLGTLVVLAFSSLYVGNSFAAEVEKNCTITVRDNQTGNSYTITIHGKSCAELINEVIK